MKKTPQFLLITNKSNIAYLSNFTGSSGFMLVAPKKSYLFTDFRYIERAKNKIKPGIEIVDITKLWKNPESLKKHWQSLLKKLRVKELGVEEGSLTVERYKKFKKLSAPNPKGLKTLRVPKVRFKNATGLIEAKREIKSNHEIKLIEKSQSINEKIFLVIKNFIQSKAQSKTEPPTEIEVAWKIKELAQKFGAEGVSFDPIVAFGKHTALSHHEPNSTKLKKGDIVMIDMGMKYKGYCSDMTRMIFTAKPTEKQKEIYNLVLKAQENALSKIKAGISGKHTDSFARKIIVAAGHGENYGHAGGHGIGLDIHESPSLSENYKKPLKENSVITVEPGIYLTDQFGIRIEDMAIVKKSGIKNLTKISKKLF